MQGADDLCSLGKHLPLTMSELIKIRLGKGYHFFQVSLFAIKFDVRYRITCPESINISNNQGIPLTLMRIRIKNSGESLSPSFQDILDLFRGAALSQS